MKSYFDTAILIYALENAYRGDGWPVITGQDCDRENVRRIIAGQQAMSAFKDTRILVAQTVKMVCQDLNGEPVDTLLRDHQLMPSITADTINEALFDLIGDTALACDDDRLSVVEEYREDLSRLLEGNDQ